MDIRGNIRANLQVLREQVAREDSDSPLRKKLLKKIDELRKDFQEVCHEMDQPEDIRLAEVLHKKFCHWNHTDGCSWEYEKWDGTTNMTYRDAIRPHSARGRYLTMARNILDEFSLKQALRFLELCK